MGTLIFVLADTITLLNAFCNVYVTNLGGAWYGLTPSLTCKENVSLKHPIPDKASFPSVLISLYCGTINTQPLQPLYLALLIMLDHFQVLLRDSTGT